MSKIVENQVKITWQETAGKPTTATVVTDNRDWVAYDLTRPKRGWPGFDNAPFIGFTFLAWSALRRNGKTALKLDEFLEAATEVTPGGDVPVNPTQPETEPGSPLN